MDYQYVSYYFEYKSDFSLAPVFVASGLML